MKYKYVTYLAISWGFFWDQFWVPKFCGKDADCESIYKPKRDGDKVVTYHTIQKIANWKKQLYGSFLWIGFNCLKARATSRWQFTFYHFLKIENKFSKIFKGYRNETLVWNNDCKHFSKTVHFIFRKKTPHQSNFILSVYFSFSMKVYEIQFGLCYIWDKVFKSGQSKFCARQPLKNLLKLSTF